LTFPSPRDLIHQLQGCIWEDQHLAVELLVEVVERGDTMIGEMIGITTGGEALVPTGGEAHLHITGAGISGAEAGATHQEEGTTPQEDTKKGIGS